jgi:hypothetical protein
MVYVKKLAASAAAAVALAAAGCGQDQVYTPAAWGPPGHCYYVYSPYECYGHHPGVPVLMPLWWHERYAYYYDSPAYIDTYVPGRYRRVVRTQAGYFDRSYARAIRRSASTATWRSSTGKTVAGSKVTSKSLFGSGPARSTGLVSGAIKSPCASVHETWTATILPVKFSFHISSPHISTPRVSSSRPTFGGGTRGKSVGSGGGKSSKAGC